MAWKFVVESYVDDIFGGAKTKSQALQLKNEIIRTGIVTSARANFEKCHGPCQRLKILGMLYDAKNKRCTLQPEKITKYLRRIKKFYSKSRQRLKNSRVWLEIWFRQVM